MPCEHTRRFSILFLFDFCTDRTSCYRTFKCIRTTTGSCLIISDCWLVAHLITSSFLTPTFYIDLNKYRSFAHQSVFMYNLLSFRKSIPIDLHDTITKPFLEVTTENGYSRRRSFASIQLCPGCKQQTWPQREAWHCSPHFWPSRTSRYLLLSTSGE